MLKHVSMISNLGNKVLSNFLPEPLGLEHTKGATFPQPNKLHFSAQLLLEYLFAGIISVHFSPSAEGFVGSVYQLL